MLADKHWLNYAAPRLVGALLLLLGLLVLVLSQAILTEFAKIGLAGGLIITVTGGAILLVANFADRD
jgi:hypothetical protein